MRPLSSSPLPRIRVREAWFGPGREAGLDRGKARVDVILRKGVYILLRGLIGRLDIPRKRLQSLPEFGIHDVDRWRDGSVQDG